MTKFGVIITALYIALILLLRWGSLPDLATMPLNEFGDFFAGVFGPLMLFWLILGYIQQQSELQQNTKALELQAEELKKSVEQHKELVKATREQVQADLKALEIEEIRAMREAHPNFSITGAGWSSMSGAKVTYQINLINSGRPASSVSFSTVPEIEEINPKSVVHYFNEGQRHTLQWDTEKSGKAPSELKLIISCKDANTSSYNKMFDLILDEDNKYHIVNVAEVS
ncbi:hypothetical protein Q8V56_003615 [Vibrio cholerae]|uniref:hypothetical protein n=1 Tax=Vibrio cholerae TaxID=666 RepID=UPI001A9DD63E|nr:hypothetical protein [Vibrio cholerae]EGR4303545.1 hypothetical protein [Vibrio cholerae]ELI0377611.1 hypothetical protein [Vibrio cholerae]MBO1382989.1 hypothetical protein [Vibrio cholerae]MBO1390442.1 hypothetical protein [Vibrio cholerae]MBO1397943.1 hypothetical protein [Vibrio cholerae]